MEMSDAGFVNKNEPLSLAFTNAKSYLLSHSTKTGLNVYDHLISILTAILNDKKEDVIDDFEDISKTVKRSKFLSKFDTLQNKSEKVPEAVLAEIQATLFTKGEDEDETILKKSLELERKNEEPATPLPNLMELCFFFEQAGVGLSREEVVRVWLALKNLVETHPLQMVRFWGKLFGTEQNYYIAEAEYRDGQEPAENELEELFRQGQTVTATESTSELRSKVSKDEQGVDEELEDVFEEIPKPEFKAAPIIPREMKTGCNKKVYFVCNEPGKEWIRLPHITPADIAAARKIKKFLSGHLDSSVVSFPPFRGVEANFLRAQIARISATTQISPAGFYKFDEEEEEEEEGGRDNYVVDDEWEPLPARELIDPTLSNWVHNVQYILPQGRCTWFNPVQKSDEDAEDEDDEDREEPDEIEPEEGRPPLSPLSEDSKLENDLPAWSAHLSSKLIPQYAVAVMHSNLWPGAHAFAIDKKFENIYIGWGVKYSAEMYSPPPPEQILMEFPSGPEITEDIDPSPEQEATLRAQIEEQQQEGEEGEEEAEDALDDELDDD